MINSGDGQGATPSVLQVPSSQILTLIQHHLTECGLVSSSQALQSESSIGSQGLLAHAHVKLQTCAKNGDWGQVLDTLSNITLRKSSEKSRKLDMVISQVHEMTILELADMSEMDLAFATLRVCRDIMDVTYSPLEGHQGRQNDNSLRKDGILSQSVERRLHALAALRSSHSSATVSGANVTSVGSLLPPDYYGPNSLTKEKRRQSLSKILGEVIPIIPSSRLVSLVQQAIKWQIHTGEIPFVKDLWLHDGLEHYEESDGNNDAHSEKSSKKKRKKANQSIPDTKKRFDLVLGQINIVNSKEQSSRPSSSNHSKVAKERIPLDPYSIIKFSKTITVTSATFLIDRPTDSNLATPLINLITASSDGFIEIWDTDSESKYIKLRTNDLEYQKKDELMCHYNNDESSGTIASPSIHALTVNADGTLLASGDNSGNIKIWNIQTGKCLRQFNRVHGGMITCLDFSRDGEESSRILSASQDGTCREFGLRTRRMLKEFPHGSFVNTCAYVLINENSAQGRSQLKLLVVTGSGDGKIQIFDGQTAEVKHVLNPSLMKGPGISGERFEKGGESGRNIHSVLNLHTPADTMIVVPRGPNAYLMSYTGIILHTYALNSTSDTNAILDNNTKVDFVTATVSPTNKWLYAVTDDGSCLCFDVASGKLEKKIQDFGKETTGGKVNIEITGILHHPHKGRLAGYSSSRNQKRGVVTLWK